MEDITSRFTSCRRVLISDFATVSTSERPLRTASHALVRASMRRSKCLAERVDEASDSEMASRRVQDEAKSDPKELGNEAEATDIREGGREKVGLTSSGGKVTSSPTAYIGVFFSISFDFFAAVSSPVGEVTDCDKSPDLGLDGMGSFESGSGTEKSRVMRMTSSLEESSWVDDRRP